MEKRDMISEHIYSSYTDDVFSDYAELRKYYPFSEIYVPKNLCEDIRIDVIAVNKNIISKLSASKNDFINTFSKKVTIIVPHNYKITGCKVYGGKWINENEIPSKDCHFLKMSNGDCDFCLGVPESFRRYKNVILQNVKTVENMLTAYELLLNGTTDHLCLFAYSHGKKGELEYEKTKK